MANGELRSPSLYQPIVSRTEEVMIVVIVRVWLFFFPLSSLGKPSPDSYIEDLGCFLQIYFLLSHNSA